MRYAFRSLSLAVTLLSYSGGCGPTVVVHNNVPIGTNAGPDSGGGQGAGTNHGSPDGHGTDGSGAGHDDHGSAAHDGHHGGPGGPTCSKSPGTHWSYDGTTDGPSMWGALDPAKYGACSTGKKQSPIDIDPKTVKRDGSLNPPKVLLSNVTVTEFVNNGHTLEMHFAPGSGINIDGKDFALKNVHFHSPAEHTVGGKLYDMEMHIVHVDSLENATAARVLGAFMEKSDSDHPLLSSILSKFPGPKHHLSCTNKAPSDFRLNLMNALPKSDAFWTYEGGLTTPGCGEFVQFFLAKSPMPVSQSQIDRYVRTVGLAKSNRPVQPLNGRIVRTNR